MAAAHSRIRCWISSIVVASSKSILSSASPPLMKWTWASLKPGTTAASRGVDDLGLRPAQAQHVAVAADADDLIAAHGDGFRHSAGLVGE